MSNLEKILQTIDIAKKGRYNMYKNPKCLNEVIVLDCDKNQVNIITIVNDIVTECTCEENKPCQHMVKASLKYRVNIAFEEKKKVVKKTKKDDKVIKLKKDKA